MSSSVSPSLKYSFSASVLRFTNGKTAIEGWRRSRFAGGPPGGAEDVSCPRSAATTLAPLENRSSGDRLRRRATVSARTAGTSDGRR